MCGILFKLTHKAGSYESFKVSSDDFTWELHDRTEIYEKFVKNGSTKLQLTTEDQRKLQNLTRLRSLFCELSILKNSIKNNPWIETKREIIQREIDEILGDGEREITKTNIEFSMDQVFENMVYLIAERGPDFLKYVQHKNDGLYYQYFSSVLSLRDPLTEQPQFMDSFGIQYNGELYNEGSLYMNDTAFITKLLEKNVKEDYRSKAILKTIGELSGEFSILISDFQEKKIYFARDCIGKRSLLYSLKPEFCITSVPPEYGFENFYECENKVYTFDISNNELSELSYSEVPEIKKNAIFGPDTINTEVSSQDMLLIRVSELREKLQYSCKLRQSTIHPIDKDSHSVGILFSGGLDCTIIASLIAKNIIEEKNNYCTNIELFTVGFEHPRSGMDSSMSPDRKLAKKSWFNLSNMFNSGKVNFQLLEIDVSYEEWLSHKSRVKKLMYPASTEMDLSIAIAFYFASRGRGRLITLIEKPTDYDTFLSDEMRYKKELEGFQSSSKVLFSGLGADELFAGYSRHEAVFNNLTKASTENEINERFIELSRFLLNDIQVIHRRNLGRDDRVMSTWGIELRYPYLDIDLINYAASFLELRFKFDFEFRSVTNRKNVTKEVMFPTRKVILRHLAADLDLYWVKDELKRAIQFGAKSAKLEIGQSKVKGTDKL